MSAAAAPAWKLPQVLHCLTLQGHVARFRAHCSCCVQISHDDNQQCNPQVWQVSGLVLAVSSPAVHELRLREMPFCVVCNYTSFQVNELWRRCGRGM